MLIAEFLTLFAIRGRHPGQGPYDSVVPVPEIWDRDQGSFVNPGLGPGPGLKIKKIRDRGPEPALRFAGRVIQGLNFRRLSRGLKNSGDYKFSGTRSWSKS